MCAFVDSSLNYGFLLPCSAKKVHKDPDCESVDDSYDQDNERNHSLTLDSRQCEHGGGDWVEVSHDVRDASVDDSGDVDQGTGGKSVTSATQSAYRSPPPLIKQYSPSRYMCTYFL